MFEQLVCENLCDLEKGAVGRESDNQIEAIVFYKLPTPTASDKLITLWQRHVFPQILEHCCCISIGVQH